MEYLHSKGHLKQGCLGCDAVRLGGLCHMVEEALSVADRCRETHNTLGFAVAGALGRNLFEPTRALVIKLARETLENQMLQDSTNPVSQSHTKEILEYGFESTKITLALEQRVATCTYEMQQPEIASVVQNFADAVADEDSVPVALLDRIQFFTVAVLTMICLKTCSYMGTLHDDDRELSSLKTHLFSQAVEVAEVTLSLRDRINDLGMDGSEIARELSDALDTHGSYVSSFARSDYNDIPEGVLGVQWASLLTTTGASHR